MRPLDLDRNPRLQAVMDRACRIADDHGLSVVGVEHVVLATLEDERAAASQVIGRRCDIAALRDNLEQLLGSAGYRGAE